MRFTLNCRKGGKKCPFGNLLPNCETAGTVCKDAGAKVSANPNQNKESMLLWNIDNKANNDCQARNLLGLNLNTRICDCVFYYSLENVPRKVICLVELKRGAAGDAVKQIITTYKKLKGLVDHAVEAKQCSHCGLTISIVWKAHIRQQGASPIDAAQYKQELEKEFGKGNYQIKSEENITKFLRKGKAE